CWWRRACAAGSRGRSSGDERRSSRGREPSPQPCRWRSLGFSYRVRPGRSAQRGRGALRVRAPAVLRGRSVVGAGDRLVRATFHGGAHAALVIELGRLMAEADLVGGELVEHGGLLLVLGAVGQ